MDSNTPLLITLLYNGTLVECALLIKDGDLDEDALTYPMEPENRAKIHALLPMYVRTCGPVVAVKSIFAIVATI